MANLAVSKVAFRPSPSARCDFNLYSPNSAGRYEVAEYIAEKYRQVHGACLHDFLPVLVQISHMQQPLAAFGLQPGLYRPLFLEQYLNQPVEQHIARIAGRPIDRCSLMEIGNLVITKKLYSSVLLVVLASSLAQAGYDWMVFTATRQVARLVRGMGFDPVCLVTADPERLGKARADWGTYYSNNPGVMVGSTAKAVKLIDSNPCLRDMADQYQEAIRQVARSLSDYRRIAGE